MSHAPKVEPLFRLDEWVIKMIETGQVKTPEFQAALKLFGREKFEKIWKRHQETKKPLKVKEHYLEKMEREKE